MSQDAMRTFWAQVGERGALSEEFRGLLGSAENVPADRVVALGAQHGLEFTTDELRDVLSGAARGELSEAELEGVAGGSMQIFHKEFMVEISGVEAGYFKFSERGKPHSTGTISM